jgi:hypothetical protein
MTDKLGPAQYVTLCHTLAEWIAEVIRVDFMESHRPVSITHALFDDKLFAALSDGVVLCELMHKVQPGVIPKIHGG